MKPSVTTAIKPQEKFLKLDLKEIWQYRELLVIFAWRDIKVRYKQTILGVLWAIIQPLTSTFVFTIFFGKMAKIPSGELPYSLFVLIGVVFWNLFSNSLSAASNSLVSSEHIIKKVYFPRAILPLSSLVTSLIDFLINFLILIIAGLYFGYLPGVDKIPLIILVTFLTSLTAGGLGLFFSALNVKYRDVRYVLPFAFQTLMFITPVIYPLNIISRRNSLLASINPMTLIIEVVRGSFSGNLQIDPILICISSVSIIICIIFGIWYFQRTQHEFADIA